MKSKRSKINKVSQLKVENPLTKTLNVKNREQLRKRLKRLLEKDEKNQHLLSPDKSTSRIGNDLPKASSIKNILNSKPGTQARMTNVMKQSITPKAAKANPKGKAIKRKPEKKLKHPNKTAKLSESYRNSNDASTTMSQNGTTPKQSVTPNVKRKPAGNGQAKVKPIKKKKTEQSKQVVDKTTKIKKKKLPQAQSKNKISVAFKQKFAQGEKILKSQKDQKKNVPTYRGPFRPNTSESDTDDSVCITPPYSKHKSKQKVKRGEVKETTNNEQALTRVTNKNENSSDETFDDQDDDYYSHDSDYSFSIEYDSNSGDDSYEGDDMSYLDDGTSSEDLTFLESESDRTYELPENVAEDIYIANGTAVKHDLSENNEVGFDSDDSCAQIIEMPTSSITQPTVTSSSKTMSEASKSTTSSNKADYKKYESDDSCPELVPIDYNNHIHDDTDSCCSSCLSFSGSDTETGSFLEASDSSAEVPQMTPEIFQANKSTEQDVDIEFFHTTNGASRNYITGSPLHRIANSQSKTPSYKVFTTNDEIVCPETMDVVQPKLNELTPKKKLSHSSPNKISPLSSIIASVEETFETKIDEIQTEKSTLNVSPVNKETNPSIKQTRQAKSSFRTLFFNAINSNHVIVLLKDPLYIYGTVKLKLLAGCLEIFGYNPKRNETLEIFSPRGYSSLKIEASKSSATNATVNEKELLSLTPYFIRTDLEEIIEKFETNKDAVVILERNDRSKKVNMLRKYMVEHLFPNMNSLQSDRPFYTSEFLLRCIITPKADKALIVDTKWKHIMVTDNSRVMIIGGKAVGKTTLMRFLVNKNLNKYPKILLIDLDIGQPEVFVPQTVSATTLTTPLLGPGYFLNKLPDKAFLVGQTNVVLLPQRYIENVKALMEYCKANEEYRDIPWIVNTMGYNKGFGDELIAVICNLLHPTNIIQLESNREINNFDLIMSKENLESLECNIIGDMYNTSSVFRPQHHLTLINSVIPNDKNYQKEWDMNPRDMRLAMIITRLSNILTGHAEWLTDIKPVCASTDDLKIINLGDDQVNTEDLLQTLIGNLVYLCRQESEQVNECLGIGIVRGIDYPLKQIYLLPAVPLEVLEKVNCLAICGIPLPSSILINQGPKVKGVASYVYNTVDEASSMYIKQIYHRPQHFLTGRHKSVVE